jgi:hypothetical protein
VEIWAILWQGIAILSATPDMDIEPLVYLMFPIWASMSSSVASDMGIYEQKIAFPYDH